MPVGSASSDNKIHVYCQRLLMIPKDNRLVTYKNNYVYTIPVYEYTIKCNLITY